MVVSKRPLVIVVTGMPGSGKTTLLNKWKSQGKIDNFCDNYQNNPVGKFREPEKSLHYRHLVNGLKRNETWAISEIRYCDKSEREIFTKAIKKVVPWARFKYVYFENRPDICEHNIIIRGRGIPQHETSLIYYYTDLYRIPKGVKPLTIHEV